MLLSIALLAQLSTIPTAPQAPTPVEIRRVEPGGTRSLSEIAGKSRGALVWPTDPPRRALTPYPTPLPTYDLSAILRPTATPFPTAVPAPPPVEKTPFLSPNAVIGLVALAAVAVLVFVWRSRKGPDAPAAIASPPRRPNRPAPVPEPAPVATAATEWLWGGKVGKAEELDVFGPDFHHRFLRRWGDRQDGELGAVGESFYMDALEGLVLHVVRDDVRSGSFDAWLKPEPDNPHDRNAVAVVAVEQPDFIEKVGHLPKAEAKRWQPVLLELERKCGRGYLAHGRVIKGREEGHTHSVVIQGGMGPLEEILTALDAPPVPVAPKKRSSRKPKDEEPVP